MKKAALVAVLAIAASMALTPRGSAQRNGPLFGLRPSLYGKTTLEKGHFQYAVKAGSSVQDAVEVLNLTDQPLTVTMYAADLEQSPSGSVSPAQANDEMKMVGAWMNLERDTVTLAPKAKRYVSFSVEVPKGIGPGDYLGAVVGSVEAERTANGLTVESRVALTARVRIPGEPKLDAAIGSLRTSDGGRAFTVELRNTGNLFFTTQGTVDIESNGQRVASLRLSPPDVYLIPGGRATFAARWDNPPLFGDRVATASFDTRSPDEGFHRLSGEPLPVSYRSDAAVLGVVALIALAIVLLMILRRRTSKPPPTSPATLTPAIRR